MRSSSLISQTIVRRSWHRVPWEWLPKRRRVGPSASLDESIRILFASYIMLDVRCQTNIT